jgi:glutamyl-tRNA synthetase
MSEREVRVRIAPSPTGYFHVGTARAAIFNWLLARHTGGKFLVRVEDTDLERSKSEYKEQTIEDLKWLGLDWDEDIVYQSERVDIYRPFAEKLLAEGKAYRCFCTPEEIAQKRQEAQRNKTQYGYDRTCRELTPEQIEQKLAAGLSFALRLKLPTDGTARFQDAVLGAVEREYKEMDDLIILRSDGRAIYNFAVVVDDHEMGITHVIRGNDHVNNTFLQIEIYKALGWELPTFGHVPLILRPDRSKVSKRKGDKGVTDYRREGYLADAFFNFLSLLGWSPKDDREKMTRQEIIDAFSLDGINPSNAVFDPQKLLWFNGEYIREMTNHQIAELVAPQLVEKGLTTKYHLETRWQWLMTVVGLLKERCKLLTDFADIGFYFFVDEFTYDERGVSKHFLKENTAQQLTALAERFEGLDNFDAASSEAALYKLAEELEVKPAKLIHPTRLAVSGLTGGPSLFHMLEAIGKERVLKRMKRAIRYIKEMGEEDG